MTDYTLFSQGITGTLASDPTAYTLGVQFTVSVSGTLHGIWFYSPATVAVLPQTIALYQVTGTGTGTLVTSQAASWLTAPGGSSASAGSGWCFAAFSSPPSISASTNYKACVLQNTNANWYSTIANYWSSGAGSGGISNGPLSAPNNAGADQGQDTFTQSATLSYPATSFNATNYLIDPQVTIAAGIAGTAPLRLTVARRNTARAYWRGFVSSTVNAAPVIVPFTARTDFIPGRARPGFATPGNPLGPAAPAAITPAPPAIRLAGQSAAYRETYRFNA